MSRPVEHYNFDPGFPEIVITSATPRVTVFGETVPPQRRAKSQDPGLLRVPNREIGDKRATDTRALQGLLRRSPSTPDLIQKYAAKAPWALEGKGPARLDLSLWRSKKSQLPTEILTAEHISTSKTTPKQSIVTVSDRSIMRHLAKRKGILQAKPPLPEIPTVLIDMDTNAIPKMRSVSLIECVVWGLSHTLRSAALETPSSIESSA